MARLFNLENPTVAQKGHTCKLKMLLQTKFNLQIKNVAAN